MFFLWVVVLDTSWPQIVLGFTNLIFADPEVGKPNMALTSSITCGFPEYNAWAGGVGAATHPDKQPTCSIAYHYFVCLLNRYPSTKPKRI